MSTPRTRPRVLCLGGLDPSGGAGLAADLDAVRARGGHALPLCTALTVQSNRAAGRVEATAIKLLTEQFDALEAEAPIAAIKVGLLASAAQVRWLAERLRHDNTPLVLDPVLYASGGQPLSGEPVMRALRRQLLPRVTVLTPNHVEALALVPGSSGVEAAGAALRRAGCQQVLITGGDQAGCDVVDCWWPDHGPMRRCRQARVPGTFRGTGCRLAAALATGLAHGLPPLEALKRARRYLRDSLRSGYTAAPGAAFPGR